MAPHCWGEWRSVASNRTPPRPPSMRSGDRGPKDRTDLHVNRWLRTAWVLSGNATGCIQTARNPNDPRRAAASAGAGRRILRWEGMIHLEISIGKLLTAQHGASNPVAGRCVGGTIERLSTTEHSESNSVAGRRVGGTSEQPHGEENSRRERSFRRKMEMKLTQQLRR
jgi:hypothetical protein